MVIDNFARLDLVSTMGTSWRAISDQVMGGVSTASVTRNIIDDRPCLHLKGEVCLENNGGFIKATLDLTSVGNKFDASGYTGVSFSVRGNNEKYSVHLRTLDCVKSWQSYRAHFTAGTDWETINFPFETFTPHRLEASLNTTRLRRIGIVAIGQAFHADLAVSELEFYL
jgi:hypothetical protein